ncbi:MAG: heparinase II/III family protein, partial [Gemmatimonadota bacterium]|nr:heparinase II/III family protein [Gemmatimonadota bacterium]
ATGDTTYARRAVLILDAFARYYPGFLVSYDRAHEQKGFVLEPPYPNFGGKWGRWRADEMPTNLALAYDAIYTSGELERLSDAIGIDVKKRIEDDFFRGAIRQEGFHEITYGNASPRIYVGYAVIGRVLNDPELVHEAIRRSIGLFERQFYADGFWHEGSLGYHRMTMAGMQVVFDALKGYSDPLDYVSDDGVRYDKLDLERDIAIVRKANHLLDICRYPDGRWIPMHDAWARLDSRRVDPNVKPLEQSHPTLLSGIGHAWLGRGKGEHQVQVHLHFSGAYGHAHADNLNLMLFAKGQELLSDVGYTHTRYRSWATSTLCHNTVLIDEGEQERSNRKGIIDGSLLAFEAAYDPVQWVEASGEDVYPGLAEEYRRLVMLVNVGGEDHYVVDLFRVRGGDQRDWVMHGSADVDMRTETNVPLQHYGENLLPGVKVRFPEHERDQGDAEGGNVSFAFFQNVLHSDRVQDARVTFHGDDVAVRIHLVGLKDSKLFVGDAPSVRRADEDEPLLDQFRMPMLMVRQKGRSPSRFMAVHEPFRNKAFIDSVEVEDIGERGVYLKVRHRGSTDHIVLQSGTEVFRLGDLTFQGEVGFVREQDGEARVLGLWGGEKVQWQITRLTGGGIYTGQVTDVLRIEDGAPYHALVVNGLSEMDDIDGAVAVVTFGDGTTRGLRVQRLEGEHVILEDDPGFRVTNTGMAHCFFPLREIEGTVQFQIRTSAFVTIRDEGVEQRVIGSGNFEVK